jgi:phosphate transport system ATP-binding protein
MVFQKPNPFPASIFDNVAYGPRLHGTTDRAALDGLAGRAWWGRPSDEVKDKLHTLALSLSGASSSASASRGPIAVQPEVLLMDEPTSALDPCPRPDRGTRQELKTKYTVIIVTHNMQQAARISDLTAFFLLGRWSRRSHPGYLHLPRRPADGRLHHRALSARRSWRKG